MGNDTLLDLAVGLFGELTFAEQQIVKAVPVGAPANCLEFLGENEGIDLDKPESLPPEVRVRAAFIEWLCCSEQVRPFITRLGIEVFGAHVQEAVNLTRVRVPFPVEFRACALSAPLTLTCADLDTLSLHMSWTREIFATGCRVRGDITLTNAHIAGGARFDSAQVDGRFVCSGATLEGPALSSEGTIHDVALSLGYGRLAGSLVLNDQFRATGQIRLDHTRIEGALDCTNGVFINPTNTSMTLNCTSAWIGGDVYLNDDFFSLGECRFLSSRVEGDVRVAGGTLLAGVSGHAFTADRARFGRSWVLECATICGEVRAVSGNVALDLDLDEVEFVTEFSRLIEVVKQSLPPELPLEDVGEWESGATFEYLVVGLRLRWRDVTVSPRTYLNLSHAQVRTLSDDIESWPTTGNLMIDGLSYDSFASDVASGVDRLAWLNRTSKYSPQPFEQLTRVLRSSGREDEAVLVAMAKQEARRKAGVLGTWGAIGSVILKYTVGHGYRPQRALLWAAGVMLLGSLVFRTGASLLATTTDVPSGPLSPFAYSVDVFVPVIDLGQAKGWTPDASRGGKVFLGMTSGGVLRLYYWLHMMLGWLLSTLAVAGFSGLIKKD